MAKLVSFRESFQDEKLITMKGSNKSRWVIAIVIVVATVAAIWFWQSRSASQETAPGATKPAQHTPGSA
ncbi:hypothetical protein ACQP3L_36770, partial [Escherichia coli]